MREFRLEKTEECGYWKYDCKIKGVRQVELRSTTTWVKLRFGPDVKDITDAMRQVIALGGVDEFESSAYFKEKIYGAQAATTFIGPLKELPDKTKFDLFVTSLNSGAIGFLSEQYKGKTYLSVMLGVNGDIYNSLRLNRSARVAKVLNDRLLDQIKKFGKFVPVDNQILFGLKIEDSIDYKDFTKDAEPFQTDKLQLYIPSESIKKFADNDITSQQFIDACTVLVNDNRIQVNLSAD